MRSARRLAALAACGLLLLGTPVRAGGPWRIRGDGTPMAWAAPVEFRVDAGSLGSLTHVEAEALLQEALDAWNAVGALTLTLDPAGALPDVDAKDSPDANASHYLNFWNALVYPPSSGAVKVIFDDDGAIVEDMFGLGAADDILGIARIDTPVDSAALIEEASLVINGRFLDGVPPELDSTAALTAVMMHEVGHTLNLGHSAVNHQLAADGDKANDRYVPTMYPLLVDNEEELAVLHADDIAALTSLYTVPVNKLQGVVSTNMTAPASGFFQGAQVVARRVDAPPDGHLVYAYSAVSGARFFPSLPPGPPPAGLQGLYEIRALETGQYRVCIEQIDRGFSDANGTVVGPLVTPPLLPGPEECYDLAESDLPTDDPDAWDAVAVAGTVGGIHVFLNRRPLNDPFEPIVAGVNDTPGSATSLAAPGDTTPGELQVADLDFFAVAVAPGDRLQIDVDAAELGYGVDTVIGLYDGAGNPVLENGVPVVIDDAVDPDSGEISLDPFLLRTVDFPGPVRVGVTCYPDHALTGCDSADQPYWIRVQVDGDLDGDGVVDRHDVCPGDVFNDGDGDGLCVAGGDGCPLLPVSGSAADADGDGLADECDVCPSLSDPDQEDADEDGVGDICDSCTDRDDDGLGEPGDTCALDNCPEHPNPGQEDADGDGSGDACDPCPASATEACLDSEAPDLVLTLPFTGSSGVSTSSDLLLFMDETVDPDTVDARSVILDQGGVKVPGTATLTNDSVITFDPENELPTGTAYTLRMTTPLADTSGNVVVPVSATFETFARADQSESAQVGSYPAGASQTGAGDLAGTSVAMLGDVNGDGFDDYLYGSPSADDLRPDAGKATLVLGSASSFSGGAPARIDFVGPRAGQGLGVVVADAGDLNGDGLADLAFSAPSPAAGPSRVWVIFGSAGWSGVAGAQRVDLGAPSTNLADCASPGDLFTCGVVFHAPSAELAGLALSRAADIHPDPGGLGEFLIGSPNASPPGRSLAGKVYMVYGGSLLPGDIVSLPTLESAVAPFTGMVFHGESSGDRAGRSLSEWANADLGLNDLILGAPMADTIDRDGALVVDAGYVYAIHPVSGANLTEPITELSWVGDPAAGANEVTGVVFLGTGVNGQIGRTTVGGVDVDGDGVDDVIFSANGSVYAISGDGTKTLTTSSEGERREELGGSSGSETDDDGASFLRQIGRSSLNDFITSRFVQEAPATPLRPLTVGGGGDVNGDGVDDFVIGDPDIEGGGRVYVVFGRRIGWPAEVSLADIGVTIPGFLLAGSSQKIAGIGLGSSVDAGADINGDCLDDVVAGAPGGNGSVYVYSPHPPAGTLDADKDGTSACVDCNDLDPTSSSTPSEARGLRFASSATIDWFPPAIQGGTTIRYDVLRSNAAADFSSPICVESNDSADTLAVDATEPAAGECFHYLVRAENDCPSGPGPLGEASDGTPRTGGDCS